MTITLETNVLPPIVLVGDEGVEAPREELLQLIAPTLRGVPALGTIAPYGEATPGLGALVTLGILGLAAYGAWRLVRRGR